MDGGGWAITKCLAFSFNEPVKSTDTSIECVCALATAIYSDVSTVYRFSCTFYVDAVNYGSIQFRVQRNTYDVFEQFYVFDINDVN